MKLFANVAHNFATTRNALFRVKTILVRFKAEADSVLRCVRIVVYFVLIIVPANARIINGSGVWSVHADIISVQISETSKMRVCTFEHEAQITPQLE